MSPARLQPGDAEFLAKLGLLIKLHRVRADLSQDQLATRAGMSRAFLGALERGAHSVQILLVRHLATALDVPLPELLPGHSGAEGLISR